jgi:hypothetical protein
MFTEENMSPKMCAIYEATIYGLVIAIWTIVPSFFWFRGVWRNNLSDRWAAVAINGLLIIVVSPANNDLCATINLAGLWFFFIGLLTLALSSFWKSMPRSELISMCLALVLVGLAMGMVR